MAKWLSLLGLAARARKLVTGEELVLTEVRRSSAKLVLVAQDGSDQTKKRIMNKCEYYNIPIRLVSNRVELGQSIGKPERVVVAVMDGGFAKKLIAQIDE
ncbi:YlxQ family RNA-binding protein [Alkalihalobacillus hemicellulosilyticus]|uniref:Ribosomal protein L7Ae family protein n=1 Tax=Halalkalibacter hemicellulosilyticusJCM 9152 TaxID=1236971 RepID=W4QD37_9BACI|nr:YlxQ family RNA-binding protein [Halalkalibacter hemicellulosilyticus]GAE29289.1 ribosomal protein L7Ae family protein [Halalkalibacter hemicellulosilyticusJCM 9152]